MGQLETWNIKLELSWVTEVQICEKEATLEGGEEKC